MFVEGEVEIKIQDRAAQILDEHGLKLWVQRSFQNMACYRISNFRKMDDKVVRAVVALKISDLPENERTMLETHPNDIGMLRQFMEKMFEGKGTCRCVGDPALKQN